MQTFTLSTAPRSGTEKLSSLRSGGQVPAVIYGHHRAPEKLMVPYSDFLRVFRTAGSSHLVRLTVNGKDENVLIYEVQKHPVSGDFLHIDFLAVSAKEKISVEIPLVLRGESLAVREGGALFQHLHEVSVRCLPGDLVDAFEVDLSRLARMGDVIHIGDLGIDAKKFDIEVPLTEPVASVDTPDDLAAQEETETVAPGAVPTAAEAAAAAAE